VVGGWQKLEAKRSLFVRSMSSLEATTFPFLHWQFGSTHDPISALEHYIMIDVSLVISFGAQKSCSGIKSAPLLKTQGDAHSFNDLPMHSSNEAAVAVFLISTGWQNSSVKSGAF